MLAVFLGWGAAFTTSFGPAAAETCLAVGALLLRCLRGAASLVAGLFLLLNIDLLVSVAT